MKLSDTIKDLGFIGAGNMAGAILRAVAGRELIEPGRCAVVDKFPEKAEELAADTGARVYATPSELVAACGDVVLAVKPQNLMEVLAEVREAARPGLATLRAWSASS